MKHKGFLALLVSVFLSLSTISFGSVAQTTKVGLSQDLIYFVMTDRYKDGDKSNNDNGGFNSSHTAFYHGGDLKGLTGTCEPGDDGLARIKSLGFSAVWLTPVVKQQQAIGSGSGYHGYWGVDFLNVDPHLGTESDMLEFSKCAKRLGLKIILDVVTNHTGDVIKYSGNTAYIPPESINLKNPSWLNTLNNYHNVGDMGSCWGKGNCTKLGDFYGLDDLATEKPQVYKGWADVYGQWLTKYGISGFRVDTARHVDDNFFKNWSPLIQAAAIKSSMKDFTIFGEAYEYNPFNLMTYVRRNKIQTVLDFPFQAKATEFASGYSNATSLTALFETDDYYTSAKSSASNLVTFLGNHDMGRIGYLIANKRTQPAEQLLPRTKLAYALMYLSRGIPVVYYGDEVGMTGSSSGKDQFARQDMFPTEIDLWKKETRIGGSPIGDGDAFKETSKNPIANYLIELSEIRKNNPALANGPMLERYSRNSIYVISKKDVESNKEYLVALNNSNTEETIEVVTATSEGGWSPILGETKVQSIKNRVSFVIPALSTIVLKANSPIDQYSTKFTKISTSVDDMTGFYKVRAGISSNDFLNVEFFVKKSGSTSWVSQGIDSGAPYSIYLDPLEFPKKKIEIKAVARNTKGESFVLPISKTTISAS